MAKRSTGRSTATTPGKASNPGKAAPTAETVAPTPAPVPAVSETKTPASADRCRACDSTDLVVLRKLGEQQYAGVGPDRKRYTSIIRRRVQCRHCGQVQVVVQRVYDPTKWIRLNIIQPT